MTLSAGYFPARPKPDAIGRPGHWGGSGAGADDAGDRLSL